MKVLFIFIINKEGKRSHWGKDPKREIILHSWDFGPSLGFLKRPLCQTLKLVSSVCRLLSSTAANHNLCIQPFISYCRNLLAIAAHLLIFFYCFLSIRLASPLFLLCVWRSGPENTGSWSESHWKALCRMGRAVRLLRFQKISLSQPFGVWNVTTTATRKRNTAVL